MAKFRQQTALHRPRGRQATSRNLAQRPDAKHGIGHETLVARGQNVRPCPNLAAFDTKRDRQTPHALAHRAEHAAAIEYRCQQTAVMHPEQIRSEEHTSELQSLMRISYAVFCLKKKKKNNKDII